jgi:hypothetical protein
VVLTGVGFSHRYVYTLDAEGKRPLLQTGPNEPFQCCLVRDFLYVAVPQAYSPS